MDRPTSDGKKKGLLARIWEQITATDCGCAAGSSCCGPSVIATDTDRPGDASAKSPEKKEPVE